MARHKYPAKPMAVFPLYLFACTFLVAVLFVLHIGLGSVALTPAEVLWALRDEAVEPFHRQIVWDLRLPRALIAILAGAMLGLAGAILQAVLHNPLAEPGLTGVGAGCALAAVLWLSTGQALAMPGHTLPLVALVGGLAAGLLVYALSWGGQIDPLRLVLTGILVSAVLQSGVSLVILLGTEALGGALAWLIGSLNGRVWTHWAIMWPWACVALPLGLASAGVANVLQLGDDVASGLGLRREWARGGLLAVAALLTAGTVAVVGALGFIGLIGPHIARRLVGTDARRVFPLSIVLTAALLVGADMLAQTVTFRTSVGGVDIRTGLPVGAVTALLGAPFFLYLIRQKSER